MTLTTDTILEFRATRLMTVEPLQDRASDRYDLEF